METEPDSKAKERLIVAAAWGQAIGLLTRAVFLAAEDAPDFFLRVSPWAFIVPILAALSLQLTKLSEFVTKNMTGGILALVVLIISTSTFLLSLGELSLAMSIPEDLLTQGWEYTKTASLVSTLVFLIALIVNVILSVGILRRKENTGTYEAR